jgi:hypothetical protein
MWILCGENERKLGGPTDHQTDRLTDRPTDSSKAICPSFEGRHKKALFFPIGEWISQFYVAKYLHVHKIPTVEETQSALPLFVIYIIKIDRWTPENQNVNCFTEWWFFNYSQNHHNFPNLSGPGPSPKKVVWEPWIYMRAFLHKTVARLLKSSSLGYEWGHNKGHCLYLKNFNFGHSFCLVRDRALIFHCLFCLVRPFI